MKMKGTKADGAIKELFSGKMKSYIKCINVEYESSRSEEFYGEFVLPPPNLCSGYVSDWHSMIRVII